MTDPVVVVGAGTAGQAAAAALGQAGAAVVMLDVGSSLPYDRPPLSKEVAVGTRAPAGAVTHAAAWWAERGVELRLGTEVVAAEPGAVRTAAGDVQPWSSLVLATGGRPRRLDVPGADLAGVVSVNDLEGASACAAALADADRPVAHVVVVGGGFIGCEVAAALRGVARSVTVVEAAAHPLVGCVGQAVAGWLAGLHHRHGVRALVGTTVEAIEGHDRVRAVRTGDGHRHRADLVVVAIGIELRLELAASLGCRLDDGVVVDDRLRTTVAGVLAVGDMARYPSRFAPGATAGRGYRCEHYDVALGHGAAAARTVLGQDGPYDDVPAFWTDQYGLTLDGLGPIEHADDVVVRGSLDDHDFLALYLRGGAVVGGLACGQRRELHALRQLLQRGVAVTADELADPAATLAGLARAAR